MAFSTLVFPFVFLPVSLILYFVLPKQLKNAALVVCSLVFFAWGTPEYLVLMVLDIAFHYFAGRELAFQKARGRSGRFVLVSSVLVNLLHTANQILSWTQSFGRNNFEAFVAHESTNSTTNVSYGAKSRLR